VDQLEKSISQSEGKRLEIQRKLKSSSLNNDMGKLNELLESENLVIYEGYLDRKRELAEATNNLSVLKRELGLLELDMEEAKTHAARPAKKKSITQKETRHEVALAEVEEDLKSTRKSIREMKTACTAIEVQIDAFKSKIAEEEKELSRLSSELKKKKNSHVEIIANYSALTGNSTAFPRALKATSLKSKKHLEQNEVTISKIERQIETQQRDLKRLESEVKEVSVNVDLTKVEEYHTAEKHLEETRRRHEKLVKEMSAFSRRSIYISIFLLLLL